MFQMSDEIQLELFVSVKHRLVTKLFKQELNTLKFIFTFEKSSLYSSEFKLWQYKNVSCLCCDGIIYLNRTIIYIHI